MATDESCAGDTCFCFSSRRRHTRLQGDWSSDVCSSDLMRLLGWDAKNEGTAGWNPLGWLVRPGDTVLIKPNLVVSEHPGGDDLVRCTDTDGPVLRCVAEYVLVALRGSGRLIVGDSPIKETDFAKATALTGAGAVIEALRRGP